MQSELPDFRNMGSEDLLGLALGDPTEQADVDSASQDLLPLDAGGGAASQGYRGAAAHNRTHQGMPAGAVGITSQDLDAELRELPIESELQPGSEPPPPLLPQPPLRPVHAHSQQQTHVSATPSVVHTSHYASTSVASITVNANTIAAVPPQPSLQSTFDSATALDDELRALPLATQGVDGGMDSGADVPASGVADLGSKAAVAPAPPLSAEDADVPPESLGLGRLGDSGLHCDDSQALDDALRALPIENSVEDPNLLQLVPTLPTQQQQQFGLEDVTGDVGARPTPAPARQEPAASSAAAAKPAPTPSPWGWGAFVDDFGGGGSFDDDLEDYLAAQEAEAAMPSLSAPAHRAQLLPPKFDDLDELITDLEYGGAAAEPASRTTTSGGVAAAAAAAVASSQRGALATAGLVAAAATGRVAAAGRSQETVQQVSLIKPQAKRPRNEAAAARGRPTMDELFGTDEEEEGSRASAGPLAAGRLEEAARLGLRRTGAAKAGSQAVEEEEEDEDAARPSSCFPPQRLASSIQGGVPLPVTSASGERVYCRMVEGSVAAERGGPSPGGAAARPNLGFTSAGGPGQRRRRGGCLLGVPLSEMLRELEDRQLRAAVAASEREEERRRQLQRQQQRRQGAEQLTEEERAFVGMAMEEEDDGGAAAAAAPRGRAGGRRTSVCTAAAAGRDTFAAGPGLEHEMQLWVDKYAPRHFMSLLSDERTNRQVALWLKDWDECVFGRRGAPGAKAGAAGRQGAQDNRADSRPQHKVLLVGGPPGLGKTTLAHVVARHCGYHPFEINASDDRTAATLLTKIQDAVQVTAVLGGGRPNCVIVDEVDGATGGSETGGAVAALLKLVRAGEGGGKGSDGGGKAEGKDDDDDVDGSDGDDEASGGKKGGGAKRRGGAGGRKGSGARQRPLCRPIICICNDLYAPALRPLRDVARVFHFSPPAAERLTARLAHICQAEQLEADPAALRLLVERTDRDVRACLNTLQFLARRGAGPSPAEGGGGVNSLRRTIEVKDIESLNIASKDTTQSAMDMWNLLLSTGAAGRGRRRPGGAGGGGSGCLGSGGGAGHLTALCNRLQDFGDYDLVLNGLHENLPRVRFMDVNLSRTAQAAEAMGLADTMLRSCRRTGDFSCLRFVPPLLAQVRALAAQPERPRQLAWPRLGGEATRRASAAAQLARSWASGRGTDPAVVAAHGVTVMALELAPALRALVSRPPLRAVAPNMMTVDEQTTLRRTAVVMLHYGLRYCFESPPPPGLLPLQLPETVAPVSNNAIILGLTAEVQQNIAATAMGAGGFGAAAAAGGGFQRQQQQPYGGGRGPGGSFSGGRGRGRGPYNSYGQVRGPGGDDGFRGPSGGGGRGAPLLVARGYMQAAGAEVAPTRHVPLVPAIDTLQVFTAFTGVAASGARVAVPHVIRQMISQQTEMEAIRRAEAARSTASAGAGFYQTAPDPAAAAADAASGTAAGRGGPLQPVAPPPPPQRQMAGRMSPPAEGKKGGGAAAGAGAKRKGTWMDAFKQQASAKARGSVGGGVSAGAIARRVEQAAADGEAGGQGGAAASPEAVAPQAGTAEAASGRLPFPVLYRFNEGYTNAVKRPLIMRELT